METSMTTKGQVVIPSAVRKKLEIKEGTRLRIELDEVNKTITLVPLTRTYLHGLRGKYRNLKLLETLAAEKATERDL